MKHFFTFIIVLAVIAGCKQKLLSGADLENKLKETMKNYLDTTLQPGIKVTVKDLTYYPEVSKKVYICQFHVKMQSATHDTTGSVIAIISNDFTKVDRRQ